MRVWSLGARSSAAVHFGFRFVCASWFLTLTFAACGGASGTELFDSPGLSGSPPGGGSNSDAADSGATDANLHDGAASGLDAGAPQSGIACGDVEQEPTYCDPQREYCCMTTLVMSPLRSCMARDLSLCTGTRVGCDSANDCHSGEVCCGVFNESTGSYTSVDCAPRARCAASSPPSQDSYVVFCDPHAEQNECAPRGETCTASRGIKGYFICER